MATVLRGVVARTFLALVPRAPPAAAQQLMARTTGNYQRCNERRAAAHLRHRARRCRRSRMYGAPGA